MDLTAAVHDSGMIKDLYCILTLPLCRQHAFPVAPHTSMQTYAVVHNLTVGTKNGKPFSCDGKTECIISICMVQWHGQSRVAEADFSIYNERAATRSLIIHRQCMHSALCHCRNKMVSKLKKKRHQKLLNLNSMGR